VPISLISNSLFPFLDANSFIGGFLFLLIHITEDYRNRNSACATFVTSETSSKVLSQMFTSVFLALIWKQLSRELIF